VPQGVAGLHVSRPLALDTSASQPFFGYQPVFNLTRKANARTGLFP